MKNNKGSVAMACLLCVFGAIMVGLAGCSQPANTEVPESVTGFGPPENPADMFRNIGGIGPIDKGFAVHERLVDIGFNNYSSLSGLAKCWDYETNGPSAFAPRQLAARRTFLDRLEKDGVSVFDRLPGSIDVPFRKLYPRVGKDGSLNDTNLDASNPKARAIAAKQSEWLGRQTSHPAIIGAEAANEVRFRAHMSFTPENIAAWRAYSGREIPPEVMALSDQTTRTPPHWTTLKDFPANHVVPDDYPVLDFYRWCWKTGDGWNTYCAEVFDAFRRGIGHDIRQMYSPPNRTPAIWGAIGETPIMRNWDYPYPDPYHLAAMAAQIQSVARSHGAMVIASVQGICYRSKLAPIGVKVENEPEWSRRFPNAKYPTVPPDLMREGLWSILSRRIDGVATHGFDALLDLAKLGKVPPDYNLTDKYHCANPETADAIKDVFQSVVIPLGPLLRVIPERDPQVAVLVSYASQILGSRISWDCLGRFYDAATLATAASLTPYFINEDEIKMRGIPKSVRVLLMADCDVLTQSAYERIAEFQKAGGLIVADENLLPALKADAELPMVARAYAATVSDHDDGKLSAAANPETRQRAVRKSTARLKEIAYRKIRSYAEMDNEDMLVSVRSYKDADYVFPLNDRRGFGDYVGPWRRMMEKGLPNSGRITLDRAAGAVYDLVKHEPVPFEIMNGKTVIPVSFETSDGKVLLAVSKPLSPISVRREGARVIVRTDDSDVLLPIRVDGFGKKPFYGVVKDGAWSHDFKVEPTGNVSVLNLATCGSIK